MTIRHKLELESISFILIAGVISIFFLAWRNNSRPQLNFFSNISVLPATPTPSPTENPDITVSSQISSDGTRKLSMRVKANQDGTKTYSFIVSDPADQNGKVVFSRTLAMKTMSIPFNTWSPDDKYFFIQENSKEGPDVMVFNATGAFFSEAEPFLDLTDAFQKRNTGNILDEATGWASETLVIINSKAQDGTKGPSYWFEVPDKAIIQLSTQF